MAMSNGLCQDQLPVCAYYKAHTITPCVPQYAQTEEGLRESPLLPATNPTKSLCRYQNFLVTVSK